MMYLAKIWRQLIRAFTNQLNLHAPVINLICPNPLDFRSLQSANQGALLPAAALLLLPAAAAAGFGLSVVAFRISHVERRKQPQP